MGYGGVLLTGTNAYHPVVRAGLGLGEAEHIVGFLYLGTPKEPPAQKARPSAAEFTRIWTGPDSRAGQSGGLPS
jgi:nitroreductase